MTILTPNLKQSAKEKKLIGIFDTLTAELDVMVINHLNDIQKSNYKKFLIIPLSIPLWEKLNSELLKMIGSVNERNSFGLNKDEMQAWRTLLADLYIPKISNLCGLNVHFDFKELSIRGLYNICVVHLVNDQSLEYKSVSVEEIKAVLNKLLNQLDLLTATPISNEKRRSILHYLPIFFKSKINAKDYKPSPILIKPLERISLEQAYQTDQILVLADMFHERIINPHLKQNVCVENNSAFLSYLTTVFPTNTIDTKEPYRHLPIGAQYHFNCYDYTDHILSTLSHYIKAKHGVKYDYLQVGILPLGFCNSLIALASFSAKVIIHNDPLVEGKPTTFSSQVERVDWKNGNFSDNIKWVAEYLVDYYGGGYGGLLIRNDMRVDAMVKDFVITDLNLILRFIKVGVLSEIDIDHLVDEIIQSKFTKIKKPPLAV